MNSIKILHAKMGHERFMPKKNKFVYSVYYILCPISHDEIVTPTFFSFNKFNVFSLYDIDRGPRDGSSLRSWIEKQCQAQGLELDDEDVVELITHPRLFGYAFNPISYWLIYHKNEYVQAVLCEVNNTFGDNHNYFLSHENKRAIQPEDEFKTQKSLYVSPYNNVL